MRNKIILTILILSIIALVFSGCGGGNPVTPPIPEPEPIETVIPETTKVVDEESSQAITSVAEDQSIIVFEKSTPQLEELAPGDIIAMGVTENTPEGLLRKVTNITKGGKGSSEIVVETEFASLEEAIEQGEFYFNEALKAEDAKEPVYYVKGIEFIRDKSTIRDSKIQLLEFNFNINAIIFDGDNNPNTEIDNITLTGQITFDYDLLLSGKFAFPHKLKELEFQNIVEVEKKLGVTGGGPVKLFSYEKVLFTQDLGIKIIVIGNILPVVLHPVITISANVDGEIFAKVTAEVTDKDIYTAGVKFDNGNWYPISSHENNFSPPSLSFSTGGSITFGVGPKLECKVYWVLGPYCKTILYGKAIADIYTNPWWKLYVGIKANAAIEMEIFSKVFVSAELLVLDLEKIIAQADGPFSNINHAPIISDLTANPTSININQTTTITCTASDEDAGDTLTYAWTKNGGTFEGSTTIATVTWRAPSTEGNYSVECEVSDGEASDSKSVNISVGDVNHPPDITSSPVTSATKGQPYSYDVNATDSDGNTLVYSLTSKPSGMTINSSTGLITWTPTATGSFGVTVKVSDGELFDTQSFTVTVEETSTTLGQVQLSSPSNGTTVNTSTVTLSWGSVSGATGYEVVYDTSSSFTNPIGWSVSGTSQTTGTLTNGTTYYWRVRAFAGSQYSSWSSVWSFTKSGAIVPPTGLSVSSYWNTVSPGFPSMNLSWNAVSGATGYEMWVRPSGGSYASLGTRDAPYVTFNSNSLPGGARYVSGTTYYFKIRTVTASGTSDFTSEVSCVAAAAPSPSIGQVQLSSPSNGATLPPMNVTFIWNSVSNATKYQFILYNQQGQVALDTTKSSTSLIVALGTEETITWKVRAGDNSGNWGAWSSTWSLTLKSTTTIKSDLIVSNIWTEPNPPIAAGYTTIGIEIKNQGNADATGTFFLEFYFDGTYQGHVYINGLTAGSTNTSYWQAVTWPSDINLHTIKGVVDPDNIINESSESNNQYSIQVKATELPVGTGTLKIESVPGGAKVYIDGVDKGETPSSGYLTISNLAAGDHNLKVTKLGYKDWIGVVTIPSGSTKYEAVILESITTKPLPPTPLSPGSSSAPGPTISILTPTLQWQTVSNADYYALAISVYPYGSTNVIYNPQQIYGSSITVPSGVLESGKKYRWNMQSYNSAGWSEEVSILLYFQTEPSPSSQIERLTNGSFSSGTSGWTLVGDFWAGTNLSNYHTSPGYAAGGVNSAGSPKNNAIGWMYQTVTIPSGATSVTLSFWYNITSEELGSTAYDVLNVTIQNSAGNYLATVAVLSNLNKSSLGSYNKVTFDATSYKGQTIRVNFLATTDEFVYTVFRIDDVSLMSDG